jgi:hypothetical protein
MNSIFFIVVVTAASNIIYAPPSPQERYYPPAPEERYYPPAPEERYYPPAPQERYYPPAPQERYAPPVSNVAYPDSICSYNSGKIVLVIMAGERGTQIRDDIPTTTSMIDYHNRHHLAVTVFEHTVYLLRIQLDCSWQLDKDLFENGCNLAQDVNVWVDLNNDGIFDTSEVGAPYRWPVTSYMAEGIYDIQIYVPMINTNYMRNGQHRMRLVVTSSENYRRTCGRTDYNETREYTVNIIPRMKYAGKYFSIYRQPVFGNCVLHP